MAKQYDVGTSAAKSAVERFVMLATLISTEPPEPSCLFYASLF